ncbi:mannose-1-phosphate guanylyltransferase [Candidatus Microgenomates bacterium]|jgi:mannose-1-phosphate guanylyltransferase|nr:MAG: mannose-1-phosphate guanylyltransferase [Candidatus Microgenomates bacterium]
MEESYKNHLYVLILCGGGGTRLWPRSRRKTPKQFLTDFFGKETLFSQTVERARWLTSDDKIFVITNSDYVDEVLAQGKVISPRNIIAEPKAKNTAMAMGVGAAYIRAVDPQAIILNFASDAAIGDKEVFVDQMLLAAKTAAQGDFLVTVGIQPTFPHTGLGYIEAGERTGGEAVFKVTSFKEKPDLETAKKFVESGNYYWNANLYVWSATSVWGAFEKYAPGIHKYLEQITEAIDKENEKEVLDKSYEEVESVAVDYAISEKAENLLLVPATFAWSDVGDWKVTYDLSLKDKDNNVIQIFGEKGQHLGFDTQDCLVETENRLVATVGVSDLIIIETDDATLVCHKDKAQDVKKIVTELKEKGKEEFL